MSPITAPSIKQELHALVDALPESEVETARRVLNGLRAIADPLAWALENAPLDDEPVTAEEEAAVAEALADVAAGRVYSMQEVRRELGL